jgi:hypothetical protein
LEIALSLPRGDAERRRLVNDTHPTLVLSGDEISGRGGYRSRRKAGAAVLVSAQGKLATGISGIPRRQQSG